MANGITWQTRRHTTQINNTGCKREHKQGAGKLEQDWTKFTKMGGTQDMNPHHDTHRFNYKDTAYLDHQVLVSRIEQYLSVKSKIKQ